MTLIGESPEGRRAVRSRPPPPAGLGTVRAKSHRQSSSGRSAAIEPRRYQHLPAYQANGKSLADCLLLERERESDVAKGKVVGSMQIPDRIPFASIRLLLANSLCQRRC